MCKEFAVQKLFVILRRILKWIIIAFLAFLAIGIVYYFAASGTTYETNDVAQYGKIKGNFVNDEPKNLIFSFFPEEIDDPFTDITYHYKAKKGDAYAYECYLEFVIEDAESFAEFLDRNVDQEKATVFKYDKEYMDYTISNIFSMDEKHQSALGGYSIGYAKCGKILYSIEEQRLIYFSLGVYDGGGTDTTELCYLFSKFNIDVTQYQLDAYNSWKDQNDGITYAERKELGPEHVLAS